ncbi:crystal protein-like [Gigantopelta aegis]|uniref:crystal protein-like n=1 Tax=Gigantopelta aegis TaxID=1735272 RepID=UPI001B88748D|nr:crystal protein-like [Gigantopelta aegis]
MASAVVFLLCLFVHISDGIQYETVTTDSGSLKGIRTSKCSKFLGIPYATAERFSDPQKIPPWSGTLNATRTGPMCYQHCGSVPKNVCQKRVSENCLFLNVYRPLPDSQEQSQTYAVMVFIHGGNFQYYSGGSPLFDGEVFVSTGKVILVTINYRLGPFGFLATVEDQHLASGNFGLKDQKLALKWIHDNINYFGGSNTKITIFGQSAGAQSVVLHLLSSSMNGLFQRAIIQSCPFTIPFKTLEEASKQTGQLSVQLGCKVNDVECYRNKTAEDILTAYNNTSKKISRNFLLQFEPFGPVMDGKDVPRNLLDRIEKTHKFGKSIIVGTNSIDGALYARSIFPLNLPVSLGILAVSSRFPSLATGLHTLYGDSNGTKELLTNLITDYIFYCSSRRFADLVTDHDDALWFYIFGQPLSFEAFGNNSGCMQGACHGGELPFLFSTVANAGYDVSEAEHSLSTRMIHYWTNFAKYGNPNKKHSDGILHWPNYMDSNENGDSIQYFAESDKRLTRAHRKKFCQYFDKIGYHFSRL